MQIRLEELEERTDPVACCQKAAEEDACVERVHFLCGGYERMDVYQLDMRQCVWSRVTLRESKCIKGSFLNCVFDHCDFSNVDMSECRFHQCLFQNCKLMGSNFAEASLYRTQFQDCHCGYANFSYAKIKYVTMQACNLQEADWNQIKPQSWTLTHCNLQRASFFHTCLGGMDLRTCDIRGIRIAVEDLKGAVISTGQAIDLVAYLGVEVKD